MDAGFGVTAMELSVAAVTVKVADPLIVPEVAVIVDDPAAIAVASPALTVATAVDEDVHVAVLVRFCLLPLLYVPVAVNCLVLPAAIEAVVGDTEIEVSTAAVTVSVSVPLIDPKVAVMVAEPTATPFPSPVCGPTVATEVFDE